MMTAGKEIENLARLAQLQELWYSSYCATQRPSVNVITGVIKHFLLDYLIKLLLTWIQEQYWI